MFTMVMIASFYNVFDIIHSSVSVYDVLSQSIKPALSYTKSFYAAMAVTRLNIHDGNPSSAVKPLIN